MTPVEISTLTKTFGRNRGIDDVTFTVQQGEVFGFLGPNGAGKSTTMRLILGLYQPTAGQLRVLGHDLTPIVKSCRVARARHHHVLVIVPWPADVPSPDDPDACQASARTGTPSAARTALPGSRRLHVASA